MAATMFKLDRTPAEVRELFEPLAADWTDKSRHLSNTRQAVMMWECQRIIGLGPAVVTFILSRMEGERSAFWFPVLQAITGEEPFPPVREDGFVKIDVSSTTAAWLEWGRLNGLLDPAVTADRSPSPASSAGPAS